jgi:orotidine-5'-phosphate decarboxylase
MKQAKDYIIFPLDVSSYEQAMHYVSLLKDQVGLFKVGLELFISQGPRIIEAIRNNCKAGIFLDLKLHDIPATVKGAFLAASEFLPQFVTVHCDEGGGVLKEVARNNPGSTKILAITVLTSLGASQLASLGYADNFREDLSALALLKARLAKEAGCHGVVCSGLEVAGIKAELGQDLIVVCPGIRPAWSIVDQDDQRRIITPAQAVKAGADYLVVGRPIRNAGKPDEAAKRVADEISRALEL